MMLGHEREIRERAYKGMGLGLHRSRSGTGLGLVDIARWKLSIHSSLLT